MTLVDTNVLLDVLTDDPVWYAWSSAQIDAVAVRGSISINDIVYAELAVRFESLDELDGFVARAALTHRPIPKSALFLAGKAFGAYRKRGGHRSGVLPDFFIGAHASVEKMPLLTRDARRYRTYFPDVELLTPEK